MATARPGSAPPSSAALATATAPPPALTEEDALRVAYYRLLSRFLAAAPDGPALAQLAALQGDDTEFGAALNALAHAARHSDPARAEREHFDLFIGVGRGELVPYGSYYIAGFLNEKPLARLRQDMARLGIERAPEVKEPEDHIAAECDIMAGLIEGSFGADSWAEQKHVFAEHLAPWAGRFFGDLEDADAARLYRPLGTIGRLFMGIEAQALSMEA